MSTEQPVSEKMLEELRVYSHGPFAELIDAHTEIAFDTITSVDFYSVDVENINQIAIYAVDGPLELHKAEELDGEKEGYEYSGAILTIEAVNVSGIYESVRLAMQRLAASAYVAGRLDQIADFEDTIEQRMVRSKHLPTVVRQATNADGLSMAIDPAVGVAWIRAFRGKTKEVNRAKD